MRLRLRSGRAQAAMRMCLWSSIRVLRGKRVNMEMMQAGEDDQEKQVCCAKCR